MGCARGPLGRFAYRHGYNSPASPEATGLEIDKMNKEHLQSHFDAYIGEILRRIPAEDRKTFRIVVEDSYETGGQNWTDGLTEKFTERYGYSPLPYLPVLQGIPVGSNEMSNRFLWDLRRLVADLVAFELERGHLRRYREPRRILMRTYLWQEQDMVGVVYGCRKSFRTLSECDETAC